MYLSLLILYTEDRRLGVAQNPNPTSIAPYIHKNPSLFSLINDAYFGICSVKAYCPVFWMVISICHPSVSCCQ